MFLFTMIIILLLLVITSSLILCEARDMMNMSNPLSAGSGDTLVSAGYKFEFGFFTPQGKSYKLYVGIWYYNSNPRTVVWVANRDNSLQSNFCRGTIDLAPDGNLKVRCKDDFSFFGTSIFTNQNRTLQLQDSGNLVLFEFGGTRVIWQSFEHPTDTFLPGMKMSDGMELVSWAGPNDPDCGSYTFQRDKGVYTIRNGMGFYWTSDEHGTFSSHNELPYFVAQMLSGLDKVLDQKTYQQSLGNTTGSYNNYIGLMTTNYSNSRILMNSSGEIQFYNISSEMTTWSLLWSEPHDRCSVHDACGNSTSRTRCVVVGVLVAGVILTLVSSYILYLRRRRIATRTGNRGNNETSSVLFSYESRGVSNNNMSMNENDKSIDVPSYDFNIILSATDNFSNANKLGQGGFGQVYKGTFSGGIEIAVKRLSSGSGQGSDEFLNEVTLIAKLQHRNLVRLMGYSIKETEKILLYEYMPNKSLDAFIFDWKKRFDIILGIARGLLYLHQDSRLRVIHRDLKTSNILLDEEMNPKISDFGLARIVEGKGTEASTKKVVGTFGYMSPEYALEGTFSIKSDVFSFGVVMLEIISGQKNTLFSNPRDVLSLLGYAWRLWSENRTLDLVDPTMLGTCDESQARACVNIGLLCVQEDPNDRPSMTNVVPMLGNETSLLPTPNQPAFVVRRRLSSKSSSSSAVPDSMSQNELTISMAQGR